MDPAQKIKIGTCAWSYDDWRGGFYPPGLPAGERLAYYARHFDAVEVDSTFYHAPKPEVARHWAEVTPPGFTFACKLPKEITHVRRLRDCADLLEEFVEGVAPLGEKLACGLIQLPPSFRPRSDLGALREWLALLPPSMRFAVEFRDPAWHQPRIAELLEEHRVCWVWTDVTSVEQQAEGAFGFLPLTTDFAYVRLMGDLERKYDADGKRMYSYESLAWPRDTSLENWAARLQQEADPLSRVWTFCSNHFEGFAPATVQRLAALFGRATQPFGEEEPPDDGGQMSLL